jgi:probable rRNA maturation factor
MITIQRLIGRGWLLPLSRREIQELVSELLEALELGNTALDISFVDDAEIARLNHAFLGLPGPTNVLSFPPGEFPSEDPQALTETYAASEKTCLPATPETPEGCRYLGMIALSLETLQREALLYGQAPLEHCFRLLTHGVLHLAGVEHGEEMERLTEKALGRLSAHPALG